MQNIPLYERADYANACHYEAERAYREAKRHTLGSPARKTLIIEASHLYDLAVQASV